MRDTVSLSRAFVWRKLREDVPPIVAHRSSIDSARSLIQSSGSHLIDVRGRSAIQVAVARQVMRKPLYKLRLSRSFERFSFVVVLSPRGFSEKTRLSCS